MWEKRRGGTSIQRGSTSALPTVSTIEEDDLVLLSEGLGELEYDDSDLLSGGDIYLVRISRRRIYLHRILTLMRIVLPSLGTLVGTYYFY